MAPYVSIPRAAEILGLKRQAFMEVARRERFEMITPNKQRRVLLADVHAYLRRIRHEEQYPQASSEIYRENALAD